MFIVIVVITVAISNALRRFDIDNSNPAIMGNASIALDEQYVCGVVLSSHCCDSTLFPFLFFF